VPRNSNAVVVKFLADTRGMQKGIDKVNGQLSGFSKAMKGVGVAVAGAFAVSKVTEFGKELVDLASNMEQVSGTSETLFGKASARKIQEWAEGAADALGLSEQAAISTANTFAVSGKAIGLTGDDLVQFTQELSVTAADLGAAFGTTEGAVTAIGAALRGEFDPLERYGIQLNATALSAYAAEQGISGAYATLDNATKQGIIAQAIKDQSDLLGVTGQFAREADTYANRIQVLNAKWDNLQTTLGELLLPTLVKVVDGLITLVDTAANLSDVLDRNKETIENVAIVTGVLAAAIAAYNAAAIASVASTIALTVKVNALGLAIVVAEKAQRLFNLAVKANPYIIAATAIATFVIETKRLTRAFIDARKEGKEFADIIKDEFNGIEDVLRISSVAASATGAVFYELGQDIGEALGTAATEVEEATSAAARATEGTWTDANGNIVGSTYQTAEGIADAYVQAANVAISAAEATRAAWVAGQNAANVAVSGTVLGAISQAGFEDARRGFDRSFDEVITPAIENAFEKGGRSGGSKAAKAAKEELVKIGKGAQEVFEGVQLYVGKRLQKVNAETARGYETQLSALKAATRAYEQVVQESADRVYEKLEEQRKQLSDTFLGFNLDDFVKVEGDTTFFDSEAFDKYFKDKTNLANRLGELVGKVDPIWIQQIAGMGVDSANATLNYLLGVDENGNIRATSAKSSMQTLVTHVDDVLAIPFAKTFEDIYREAESAGIAEAKKQLDKEADAFKKFTRKKLKTTIPVTVQYNADYTNAGPAYNGGRSRSTIQASTTIADIQAYERLNGSKWRQRVR
jgi:hypothetical protein